MYSPVRRGTVYGTLLNHRDALAALGDAVNVAPYRAPPKAPILYIKPRNTWLEPGEAIVVPDGVSELEIGATLGLVIERTACHVAESDALSFVAGYVIVNDVSIPHPSYYRPSLRFKARDTFCPIGPLVQRDAVGSPDALDISVAIDGETVHRSSTAGLIRPAARLLAEISEFMTLMPGDVLSVGVAANAPRARAGQRVGIAINGLGCLENPLIAERGIA
ncbi:fumarylacetoacetate hydrolase family protein [Paraburkholderia sp. Ac-20347]|uniref:fumarylacetoacetate hydrolase family protein n=1 Tax=Paraburkholderia sp. Ac-20347 TaxID=2703892 RepID=UPI00198203A5|nr:fumarylacetoacetate hydrolase family protein [Paraburkholderia sp. Ac-20347]MBN3809948.1 2-hydroxyhepta-2,4-diene-1,7-dioate isomerase [Paraburkholderia sp. Ac-20347]